MPEQLPHNSPIDPRTLAASNEGHEPPVQGTMAPEIGQVTVEATDTVRSIHAEARPYPAYATIEDFIEETVEGELNPAWDSMERVYEASSDEVKHRIDQVAQDYTAAIRNAVDQGLEQPSLAEFLDVTTGIPEAYKTGMLAYAEGMAKINAAEKELDKYVPEKAAEVKQKAAELEASLDYDKVVAQALADDDDLTRFEGMRASSINLLYDVSKVIGVRKLLESESGTRPTFRQLKFVENALTISAAEYRERGLVKEPGEAAVEAGAPLTNEQIVSLEAHVQDVYDVRTKYKQYDGTIRSKTEAVLDLISRVKTSREVPATDLDELYMRASVIYNDGLGVAMNRKLTQKLMELPANEFRADIGSEAYRRLVEQAKATNAVEALQNLKVTGSFDNLPFAFNEAELKLLLLTSIPDAALASVKRIQFRPLTEEEDQEDNTLGLHQWAEELGGAEIIISDAKVRKYYHYLLESYSDKPDAEQDAQFGAKSRMYQTICHEFGHELHEVLPIAALRRWETQRATDPTNITAYVKREHDSNHRHRYMEDFADTVALFINKPEILTIISPARFNAMQQIFEEFMTLYSKTRKKIQERRIATDRAARLSDGISDDAIKSHYLWHETA